MSLPSIPPITGADRPRWSVMIPAWNAAQFLGRTIESVLESDLPEGSQIEVVDDGSTDDTAFVAQQFAARGVGYFRHESRRGAPANFNQALLRSRGDFVHLLHADDEVVPGFYTAMGSALDVPGVVAAVARTQYIDDSGTVLRSTRAESATGIWEEAQAALAVSNRVRPPGIAVSRLAYESVGGFREDLAHAADWEMWMRLALHGPIWFEDRVLARYRVHDAQDTAAKVRSGENVRERVEALRLVNSELPESRIRPGLLYTAAFAGRTAVDLSRRREWAAARAQLREALRCAVAAARPG